jgi:hypothetical protein
MSSIIGNRIMIALNIPLFSNSFINSDKKLFLPKVSVKLARFLFRLRIFTKMRSQVTIHIVIRPW